MSTDVMMINKEMQNNPNKIAEIIKEVADSIDSCKNDLSEIQNRNFWKRTFSNTTKDLASAMIMQNDTISTFMNIIQGILFLNMNNTVTLERIANSLKKTDSTIEESGNQYTQMAIDYLDAAIVTANNTKKKFSEHDEILDKIKETIIEKNKIDKKQDEDILKIRDNLSNKERLDEDQDRKIRALETEFENKSQTDASQDDKIIKLFEILKEKDTLDNVQTKDIEKIVNIINTQKNEIKELTSKLNTVKVLAEKSILHRPTLIIAILGIISGIASILMNLMIN